MAGRTGGGAVVVVEDAFLLIKPDAAKYHREILAAIRDAGLQVAMKSLKGLSRSQAELVVAQYKHIQQMFHAEHIARLERDGAFVNGLQATGPLGGRTSSPLAHSSASAIPTPSAPSSPLSPRSRAHHISSGGSSKSAGKDITGQIMRLIRKEDANSSTATLANTSGMGHRGASSSSSSPFGSAAMINTPRPPPPAPTGTGRSTSLLTSSTTGGGVGGNTENIKQSSSNGIDFNTMRPAAVNDTTAVPFSFPKRLDLYQSPLAMLQHNLASDGSLGGTLNGATGSINSNAALMRALGSANNTFTANWMRSTSRRPSRPSTTNAVTLNTFHTVPSASNLFNFSATSYQRGTHAGGGQSPPNHPLNGLANFQATIFGALSSPTSIAGAVLTTAPPPTDASLFRRLHHSQALAKGKAEGQWTPAEYAFEENVEYLVSGGTCLALVLSGPRAVARTAELVGSRYPTRKECQRHAPDSLRAQFSCGSGALGSELKEGEALMYNGFYCPETFSEAAELVKAIFGYESTQRSEILKTAASSKGKRGAGDEVGTSTLPSLGTKGVASLGMSVSKLREVKPLLDALDVDDDRYIGKLLNYFDTEMEQLHAIQGGGAFNNRATNNGGSPQQNGKRSQTLSLADNSRTARPSLPTPPMSVSSRLENGPRPHPPRRDRPTRDTRLSVTSEADDGDATFNRRSSSSSTSATNSDGSSSEEHDDEYEDSDATTDDGSDGDAHISSSMGKVWEKLDKKTQPFSSTNVASIGGTTSTPTSTNLTMNRVTSSSSTNFPPTSRNSLVSDRGLPSATSGGGGGGGNYSRYHSNVESREIALQRQQSVINQIVGLLSEERRSIQLETRRLRVNELELLLRERRLLAQQRANDVKMEFHGSR